MLRTSLRAGQPSLARGLANSAIRSNVSQPLKPAHPADVVSGNVAGPPTVHESPKVLAAEVISDAPRMSFSLHVHRWLGSMISPNGEILIRIQADQIGELQHRQVRIYRPTKSTMQSAKGKTKKWILDWDVLSGSGRWENPLMGWASSADYMQGTTMAFRSQEDAVAFVRTIFVDQHRSADRK
jgi:NADH dehydrogenase (ubiquinone) Fe-S protein 4